MTGSAILRKHSCPIGLVPWLNPAHAIVCYVCGHNRAACLAKFGTKQTIEMMWDANLPFIAVYRAHLTRTAHPQLRVARCYALLYLWYIWYKGFYSGRYWQVASQVARPFLERTLNVSYVYSDLVGYQTSDIRLLWTITPNPPPPTPTPFLPPPPLRCQTSPPPPPCPPPISDLSHCHHTLEV